MVHFLGEKLLNILMVAGSLVLLSIVYFSYRNAQALIRAAGWVEHTQDVLLESDRLAMDVKNIQVNGRVYLVTEDISMLGLVRNSETAAEARIERLRDMVSDNPSQVATVDSLNQLLHRHTSLDTITMLRPRIMELFVESKAYEDAFLRTVSEFQKEEYRLLAERKARREKSVFVFEWFLSGLMVAFVLLVIAVYLSMRNLQKSLKETTDYKYALDESAIVAITDHRGVITHVNDNFCRISKYSREELIGHDHRIINSNYHSKEFFVNLWKTIAGGKVWKGEIRNKAKDGNFYWVDTSIVPILNESGRPYQYLAIRSDITERKVAEDIRAANRRLGAEIQEKNTQLASVLDRISEGFLSLDANFRYTYVNKKAGEMARRDPESMIGMDAWKLFPELVDSPTFVALNKAMTEQRYVKLMDYYPSLNIWVENHIYPTGDGLSIFIRDVTRQMEAEQKMLESVRLYRMIASTIPGSVICIVDRDYRYMLIEGDLVDKLGYNKQLIFEKKAIDVLPKERYEEIVPYFERAFLGETFSVEIRRGDYDLLTRYVPLPDQHGNITSIMVASIDVTPLKEAERRVAEVNMDLERKIVERTAQLESVNKDLESFSYSVAHDLRSPLRGVSGYTSMLMEDYGPKLDDEGRRLLSDIEYNANRMSTLIDDLLTFSKLGRKEVRKSVVDLKSMIEDIFKQMPVGRAKIRLEKLHPVLGDVSLLKHVVTNLISNAIKYSSKTAQPEITVSSAERDGHVTYSVADNGVGFDMEHAGELFGVFKRLHTNEQFEGTGVGLATAQRIIQKHGGKIWAHAKVNEGATFFFTLPAIPSDRAL